MSLRVRGVLVWSASIDQVVPAGLGRVSVAEAPRAIPAPALCTVTVNPMRSEEHTSELQSLRHIVCPPLLAKKEAESWAAPSLVVETEAVLSRVEQLAEVVGEVRWTLTVAPGASFFGLMRRPLPPTLFPYTTLFRSIDQVVPAGLGRVSVAEAPRAIPAPALCTVTVNPMGSPADTVPASAEIGRAHV